MYFIEKKITDMKNATRVTLSDLHYKIEHLFDRDGELFDEHWSDEEAKKEMREKGGKYFTGVHSDAVYTVVPELRK